MLRRSTEQDHRWLAGLGANGDPASSSRSNKWKSGADQIPSLLQATRCHNPGASSSAVSKFGILCTAGKHSAPAARGDGLWQRTAGFLCLQELQRGGCFSRCGLFWRAEKQHLPKSPPLCAQEATGTLHPSLNHLSPSVHSHFRAVELFSPCTRKKKTEILKNVQMHTICVPVHTLHTHFPPCSAPPLASWCL